MTVQRIETEIPDLVLLETKPYGDERGFLVETFREDVWREHGVDVPFVQENQSRSGGGILRGLHFQLRPGQAKLVRCSRGAIWDVGVDLRRDSPTYRRWEGVLLSDSNHRQLFIPAGFAHGFCAMSEEADVAYKLSSYYDSETEAAIRWDDPDLAVGWPIEHPQLSDRDKLAPTLAEIADELPF